MEQGGNVSPSTKEPSVSLRSYWLWDRIQCGCIDLEPCHETGGLIGVVPEEVCKSAAFVLSFHLLFSPFICFSANPSNLFPPSTSQQTRTISTAHRRTASSSPIQQPYTATSSSSIRSRLPQWTSSERLWVRQHPTHPRAD